MTVVIVGAGLAGARAAEALREFGYKGRIVLIGEESHLPYERPPLSKALLSGSARADTLTVLSETAIRRLDIALHLNMRATRIDRERRVVELADGSAVRYESLILATGLRPRPLAGLNLSHRIRYLRTVDDATRLRDALKPGTHLLIVGAGFLGLEVAATARTLGCHVTVVERNPAVLYRAVAPLVGDHIAALHARNGVRVVTECTPIALCEDPRAGKQIQVTLSNGEALSVDAVLAATGSLINSELAESAGLDVDDGVIVDEFGRTSDPDIYAAGDITRHFNPVLGRAIRLESWHNAQQQATAVAKVITGRVAPYAEVPWFWSDQYELNLQIVGYPSRWDRLVLHGSPTDRRFTALYLDGDRVVGANLVNNGRFVRLMSEWIARGVRIDAARAAQDVPLESLVVLPERSATAATANPLA